MNYLKVHEFHDYLTQIGDIDKVYNAMKQDDVSEVVLTAFHILIQRGIMPRTLKQLKNEEISAQYHSVGNDAYTQLNDYQLTLHAYNKALSYAPDRSQAMILAYGNRSALFHKMKAYKACIKDIEMCFTMNCGKDLIKKLTKRKEECLPYLHQESATEYMFNNKFTDEYFKLKTERHPDIPCASNNVAVVMEKELPKIIAAKDIEIGTVVAIEESFVSQIIHENYGTSCNYCHKKSLNLIPCDGCVHFLFCDENCRNLANVEYHNVECEMMDVIELSFPAASDRLAIKAVLKMKQMCKSWKELITASYNIGIGRMKNSSINEIFDRNNKFSLLNFDDSCIKFVHGTIYNFAFKCATILYYLDNDATFFPQLHDEKNAAMRAVARLLVNLYVLFPNRMIIDEAAKNIHSHNVWSSIRNNFGWFSFTNKLSHSCDANLLVVGLNKKVALVAAQPIKAGTELNISYLGHWYESSLTKETRPWKLYCVTHLACHCYICEDGWNGFKVPLKSRKLTYSQLRCYENWNSILKNSFIARLDDTMFKATCEALVVFHNQQNTKEHYEIFKEFRNFLKICQYMSTKNYVLGGKECFGKVIE